MSHYLLVMLAKCQLISALLLGVLWSVHAADKSEQNVGKDSGSAAADRKRKADEWVDQFLKEHGTKPKFPTWGEVHVSLKRKYGSANIPCSVFDAARSKYFDDFVSPWALENGYSREAIKEEFMKRTELPSHFTLTGKKREGCRE